MLLAARNQYYLYKLCTNYGQVCTKSPLKSLIPTLYVVFFRVRVLLKLCQAFSESFFMYPCTFITIRPSNIITWISKLFSYKLSSMNQLLKSSSICQYSLSGTKTTGGFLDLKKASKPDLSDRDCIHKTCYYRYRFGTG
jgi:hypothetical protein